MIDFKQEYILENERVLLSPLKNEHFDDLSHFSVHEPELWQFSLIQANTPEKMKIYIDKAIMGRKNSHSYPFIVFDKLTNKYAGSTRFYDIQIENAALQLGFT